MSSEFKHQIRDVLAQIRKILLVDWDPIGINHVPAAADEYDSYAGGVHELLLKGTTEEELMEHLNRLARGRMGISGGSVEVLRAVGQKLLKIEIPYKK